MLLLSRGSVVIIAGGRGVAGHGDARFEQFAIVGLIFTGYPYWYRFQTLKARGWFEVGALLAAMQG